MIPHLLAQLSAGQTSPAKPRLPLALVMVPTRELAMQVSSSLAPFRRVCSPALRSIAIYGGTDTACQVDRLADKHVIVATPGRLLDLVSRKQLSLASVTYLVIDEADRMLNMGFLDQLSAIAAQVNPDRQALLFSATFPQRLREALAVWIGDDNVVTVRCNPVDANATASTSPTPSSANDAASARPIASASKKEDEDDRADKPPAAKAKKNKGGKSEEDVEAEARAAQEEAKEMDQEPAAADVAELLSTSARVTQTVHVCAAHKKPRLLIKFILQAREEEKKSKARQAGAMLVFVNKVKTIKFVEDFLKRQGQTVHVFHGQLPQSQRERTLAEFRAGKIHTLVATDVAARGIHVKKLRYVVNYDFPSNLEQYVHRVGRTGRQGEGGISYSLITRNMAPLVGDLISLLRRCGQSVEPNLQKLKDEYNPLTFTPDDEDGEGVGGNRDEE